MKGRMMITLTVLFNRCDHSGFSPSKLELGGACSRMWFPTALTICSQFSLRFPNFQACLGQLNFLPIHRNWQSYIYQVVRYGSFSNCRFLVCENKKKARKFPIFFLKFFYHYFLTQLVHNFMKS